MLAAPGSPGQAEALRPASTTPLRPGGGPHDIVRPVDTADLETRIERRLRAGGFVAGPILALAMLLVPPLRSIGGPKKIYYKCEDRLGA